MTAIYGDNGAGKSGYTRVLGCIGFTRGDKEILPNITKQYDPAVPQTVVVDWTCDESKYSQLLDINDPNVKIPYIYVFDSTSVSVHIVDENTIAFSPAGLDHLHKLAELTDIVRGRLNYRIQGFYQANPVIPLLEGQSKVKDVLSKIETQEGFEESRNKLIMTPDEESEHKSLRTKTVTIETEGISSKITELEQKQTDLRALKSGLAGIAKLFSAGNIKQINESIDEFEENIRVANELGLKQFESGKIAGVGEPSWHSFIHSAYRFSKEQMQPYPGKESVCLFCQQPLSKEAAKIVEKVWKYLESEIQERLFSTEAKLNMQYKPLLEASLDFFREESAVHRLVKQINPQVQISISGYLTELSKLREEIRGHIKERLAFPIPDNREVPSVSAIISQIDRELSEWRQEKNNWGSRKKRRGIWITKR